MLIDRKPGHHQTSIEGKVAESGTHLKHFPYKFLKHLEQKIGVLKGSTGTAKLLKLQSCAPFAATSTFVLQNT
jgi:hypothetical protein